MTTRAPRMIVLCVLAAGFGSWPVAAGQIGGEANAFNGYTLETPLAEYPALKPLETWHGDFVNDIGVYENPGETLTLNDVPIQKIRYRFADGLLESIQLSYQGRDNRDKLLHWLEEQYGKVPAPERRMTRMVLWYGRQMTISLIYDTYSKSGWVWFASPTLFNQVNRNRNDMPD